VWRRNSEKSAELESAIGGLWAVGLLLITYYQNKPPGPSWGRFSKSLYQLPISLSIVLSPWSLLTGHRHRTTGFGVPPRMYYVAMVVCAAHVLLLLLLLL
jgi:hypothetical protein